MPTIHAFDYLSHPQKNAPTPVCVVFGDSSFLKKLVADALEKATIGGDGGGDDDVSATAFEGDQALWRDVMDELSTYSLFGAGKRYVVINNADKFVSNHRGEMEEYLEHPKSTGVLVLTASSWPSNTRLYKALDEAGLQVDCRPPEKNMAQAHKWLRRRAKEIHQATLSEQAVVELVELVGFDFGRLDQELAKLALFAGVGGSITPEMVAEIVGGWRAKSVWEMIAAASSGDASEALRQLQRLLQAGDHPLALLPQMSWSIRRFAAATRLIEDAEKHRRGVSIRQALTQAGFRNWPRGELERAETQLRQLGRARTKMLYQWLLDADLALKGSHSNDRRAVWVLEELVIRLAREFGPRKAKT